MPLHTIFNGFENDFFNVANVEFIKEKIRNNLRIDYKQDILIDNASIMRIMQRVYEERLESIPRMNQRVVMYAANEWRNYQVEADKHLKWSGKYIESQRLYDPTTERGPFIADLKLSNRLGRPRVGGTTRFYFT
jgi:hypothetical protein